MSKLFVLFFVGVFVTSSVSYKSELVTVIAICRHGMRVPSGTYNNDPLKDVHPWGNTVTYGQLTNEGKMQHYNLGKWFRKRYDGFLPRKYLSRDFMIFSSDVDRCLESAAACAAGMYPPDKSEQWKEDLLWQPIPIHASRDALLYHKIFCPRHTKLLKQLLHSDVYSKIHKENKEFFKYVSKMSGECVRNIRDVRLLYGIIHVQSAFNVTFPEWIQTSFKQMHHLSMMEMMAHTYTTEMAKLRTGPLAQKLLNQFENAIANDSISLKSMARSPTIKFILYMAHEGTLVNILNTMKIFDHHWPEFAATLLLELRRDGKKNFVNMMYKNSTGLTRLSLKECEFNCELGRYRELLTPIAIGMDDWYNECDI